MPRKRATSTTSSLTTSARDNDRDLPAPQEMGSMYDYLAKIILLGPSGCGKSCILHRFVKNDWRVLSSQTIGVEFASKIVKVGPEGGRRKRVKLQLWDTAGTERFRSVSRSYYRGAAGAVLVYDLCNGETFRGLGTFLGDARSLGSRDLTVVLAGNKKDLMDPTTAALAEEEQVGSQPVGSLLDDDSSLSGSLNRTSTIGIGLGSQQRATVNRDGRAINATTAANWASQNHIPATMEVSALTGEGVDEVFNKLASTILTKIELGEIDPDDPMSGIQYGDADYCRYDDGGSSIKSGGLTSDGYGGSVRRRRRGAGWGDVFKIGRPRSSSGGRGGCC
ncbi:GTP-binding protein ypt4 [Fulvia fulva]|uniref:GTP-binding protein ypt4 n=1 Tax=Passalora fulva TaxID=5499 RepID=A0A9Q8UUA3_PASFU|nr:GTP-binding protein ypt4 [Fulvia fulva]KAK4626842.1 GTP-binding protein ypt4 [Fulvia fulva]KAK4627987.1 GTP-binding protein ypt4 [Fulvia fulva]UJO22688.1 GTP-binding protein ypt4 [Fulvia fulva]WPV14320.1 GTP-binding protein ypt4 [Fulvia fulva]WPV28561.1 GTP-binding protein ypt4 [Fulvia fulva]